MYFSAKDDVNIQECFRDISQRILWRMTGESELPNALPSEAFMIWLSSLAIFNENSNKKKHCLLQ